MKTIADLNPDMALALLLDGKVRVETSATESHTIRAYGDEERPNRNRAMSLSTSAGTAGRGRSRSLSGCSAEISL